MLLFSPDQLNDYLPVYYKKLFPYEPYYRWLTCGSADVQTFSHREFSFTLPGDVYVRYLSFDTFEAFEAELIKKCPEKIDLGGIYNIKPSLKRTSAKFDVKEKELVFDIDITDYDTVRTCCQDKDICSKCWRLLGLATVILDTALRDDFGFNHLLWVFSGRRGIHCWVCDESARKLSTKVRGDVSEYLQVLSSPDSNGKTAHLSYDKVHPSIKRAINFIKEQFPTIVEEQNLLGTVKGMKTILSFLDDDNLKKEVESAWDAEKTSIDRWNVLVDIHRTMMSKNALKRKAWSVIDEIMLHYAYPRLDINVSKGFNHLLKSPFCVHPKTGKVCIPFNPKNVFKFNLNAVPTINVLIEEIQNFDAKEATVSSAETKRKVKDYKKTSLYKAVQVFEEFVRNLQDSYNRPIKSNVKLEPAEPMEF